MSDIGKAVRAGFVEADMIPATPAKLARVLCAEFLSEKCKRCDGKGWHSAECGDGYNRDFACPLYESPRNHDYRGTAHDRIRRELLIEAAVKLLQRRARRVK